MSISPQRTSPPSLPPAGWYADPAVPGTQRWFDGVAWTDHIAPTTPPASAPTVAGRAATVVPGGALAARPVTSVGAHPDDVVHWMIPTGRSWKNVLAGYLGLTAIFVWVLAPVAVGFGVWGLVEANRQGLHGRGRAVFGIVGGLLGAVFGLAVLSL